MTTKTKKYLEYYNQSKNKEEFVKLLLDHRLMKKQSAERRWYDYVANKYNIDEKQYVAEHKRLTIKDMVRFNKLLTREYLNKYGYNDKEINWLIDNKYITLQEEHK